MSHDHHPHDIEIMGDQRLLAAIAINILLTLAQVINGVMFVAEIITGIIGDSTRRRFRGQRHEWG